jgi:hypothetical protein
MNYDLMINRHTYFQTPTVQSSPNLPGFNIGSEGGINQLTGEKTKNVQIAKIDIWSLN